MKKYISTTLLVIAAFLSQAQSYLSPIDRLNGIEMAKQLFIKYDESTNSFLYYKDEHPGTLLQINQNDLYTIKGTDDGKYTLAIEFYNPLRVKFNFDEKRIADPAIEAINTFITKFPSEFVEFNKSEKKAEIKASEAENRFYQTPLFYLFDSNSTGITIQKVPGKIARRTINVDDYFSSFIISQWVYELNSALEGRIEVSDSAGFVSLFKDISQIEEAEKYLYGKITMGDKSKNPE